MKIGVTPGSVTNSIRSIIERTMSKDLLSKFNRDGRGKKFKRAFKKTEFYSCIIGKELSIACLNEL